MAYSINQDCTNCNACLPECPTGSIFQAPQHYVIDSDTCRDCALCVGVCPVSAIRRLQPSAQAATVPKIKKDEDEEE